MEVDVVIPAYARPELTGEAVESVLQQTFSGFRLWVVDDASPEPLSDKIPVRDPRVHFLRLEKNVGPGRARNLGVAEGGAPLVAFLDSDDLWRPEKLQKQIEYLRKNPECQWVHTNEEWRREGKIAKQKKKHRKEGGQFLARAFERCLISPSAVLLRRAFFQNNRGFAEHFFLCEDYELWLRLLAKAPVGYLAEPLTIKRAGAWEQLSSAREIDRYRVLALHRFYRQARRDQNLARFLKPLLTEAEKKSALLLKGARKYGRENREKRYQAWLTLFSTLRTRDIRWSS